MSSVIGSNEPTFVCLKEVGEEWVSERIYVFAEVPDWSP